MRRFIVLAAFLLVLTMLFSVIATAVTSEDSFDSETESVSNEVNGDVTEDASEVGGRSRALFILLTVPAVIGALVFVTWLYRKKDEQRYL